MKKLMLALPFLIIISFAAGAEESDPLKMELERLTELAARTLEQRAAEWRCEIKTRYVCDKDRRSPNEYPMWINLDFSSSTYERCDDKGCDKYDMEHGSSGIYR